MTQETDCVRNAPAGVCLWLTGLSGSGKTTTAKRCAELIEHRGRRVTLLDGDVIRSTLSPELGFSRQDRDRNIRRIAFVAREVVRHSGIVICAVISPYRAAREEARATIGSDRFVEIFVDCPLEVCEARDRKGLYALARAGKIEEFTGVSDPYEAPTHAEITISTVTSSAEENSRTILEYLEKRGYL
jgi:sulfate adenylyltransferase